MHVKKVTGLKQKVGQVIIIFNFYVNIGFQTKFEKFKLLSNLKQIVNFK